MLVQVTPQSAPDFATSGWLKFGGCGSMPGDPANHVQFAAASTFLAAVTYHFTEIAGPWFATTPQEIIEIHTDYLRWCDAIFCFGGEQLQPQAVPFSLHNLAALSRRRMQAIGQFGGVGREDYPIYAHLHNAILAAANREKRRRKQIRTSNIDWRKFHEQFLANQLPLS